MHHDFDVLLSNLQIMGQILTSTCFVIVLDFITRVAGTEVATNGVGTILVASTDIQCTLVNVYIYKIYMQTVTDKFLL